MENYLIYNLKFLKSQEEINVLFVVYQANYVYYAHIFIRLFLRYLHKTLQWYWGLQFYLTEVGGPTVKS